MKLLQVNPETTEKVLRDTLKTLFSPEETDELIEGLLLELEEESKLYSITENSDEIGFMIVTTLKDEFGDTNEIVISVEDIFTKSGYQEKEIADSLSQQLKQFSKNFSVDQIEVIINQSNSWIGDSLINHGFISSEVKLEKLLPRSNNLDDVLELIHDCIPIDRIIQVLLEKDEEFIAEFVDTSDEVSDLIDEGWNPVMVVVTYEPEDKSIKDQIEESDQLINWDDYSIVYYG